MPTKGHKTSGGHGGGYNSRYRHEPGARGFVSSDGPTASGAEVRRESACHSCAQETANKAISRVGKK